MGPEALDRNTRSLVLHPQKCATSITKLRDASVIAIFTRISLCRKCRLLPISLKDFHWGITGSDIGKNQANLFVSTVKHPKEES